MNQREHSYCNFFMLSSVPTELSFLKYQVDYHISGSLSYVKSFTIIMGSRAIRKYTLKKMLLIEKPLNIGQIVTEVMFNGDDMADRKDFAKKPADNTTNKGYNSEARNKAALNLFSELGF